jgi:hypothetical protein
MALEIKVADQVEVIDMLPGGLHAGLQILEAVAKAVKNWIASGMKDPLTITISPQMATGPPTNLGISTGDGVRPGEHIGGGG